MCAQWDRRFTFVAHLHVDPSTSHQLIDNHVVMGRHTTIMAQRPAVMERFLRVNLSHRGTPSGLIFPNHKQSKKKAIIVVIQKLHENDHLHGNCLPMRSEDAPTWQTQSDGSTMMQWTGPPTTFSGLLEQICLFEELDEIRDAPGINHLVSLTVVVLSLKSLFLAIMLFVQIFGYQLNSMILKKHFLLRQWGITTAMAQGGFCLAYTAWLCWAIGIVPSLESSARTSFVFCLVQCFFIRGVFYFASWYYHGLRS
jgi:hypothetical protein